MEIILTTDERETLKRYRRNVSGRSSYVKVTTILMLSSGISSETVADHLGIDKSTVYRYFQMYQNDGVEKYLSTDYKGYWGPLSCVQISALRQELKTNLYLDSKEVAEWIKNCWGIVYTPQGVVDLLNRIGFTYKKTKEVPCETDHVAQEQFMETFGKLISEAADNETIVYFADALHPTHNSRSTYAWIEKGTEIEQPTVSGRDRVNINAVLNAGNPTDVISLECNTVNTLTTGQLYEKILKANPNAKKIYIISDNARYYRSKELNEWLNKTIIEPLFLPPYSPNLNIIERLWKFLRKKVINTGFYRKKEDFRKAVLKFFDNLEDYRKELTSLLTLNFRLSNSQSFSF
jgi:transposase